MGDLLKGLYFSPEADQGADGKSGDQDSQEKQQDDKLEWDAWHDALPETAQKLISERESGLKTALQSEREARKTAEKDLRDVAKKLEAGSEAQNEILKLADAAAASTKKADFYEDAHNAGVTNLKLAYHIATTEELFDKKGSADFEEMKKQYPELFGKKQVAKGDAGSGTGSKLPAGAQGMNAFIRQAAGKQGQ